jgi:biotin carboxylase
VQRILILMPTRTYRAEAFIKAASRLGVEITVGTQKEQLLAPFTPGSTVALDFQSAARARQQIRDFAAYFPIDAAVGVDDEVTVLAAEVAATLGLPHNSLESVKAARYKDVFRLILSETELNSPSFQVCALADDPAELARRASYPCVLKPLALSASRGVIRADDPDSFVRAFREIAELVRAEGYPEGDPAGSHLLVESFIAGREFAIEGLLIEGRLHVVAFFDKPDPLDGPYFEETIYVTPSRLPSERQAAIASAIERAAQALGLREGPVHAEARLNEQGPWVLEVAPRSIGGLCSRALRFEADEDLTWEEIILRQALRLDLGPVLRERQPAGVMMIPIPGRGRLCAVDGLDEARAVPGVEEVTVSIPLGQPVVPLPRGDQYLGFIFARGDTPAEVEHSLRRAHRCLRFEIEPEELVGEEPRAC